MTTPLVTCKISDGLGNRFFQIAAMLGYAEKTGSQPLLVTDWILETNHKGDHGIQAYFPELQTMNVASAAALGGGFALMDEPAEFCYTHIDLPLTGGKSVKLNGYFQTEKYFPRGGVPLPKILQRGMEIRRDAVFLHIRRGDYLNPLCAHHHVNLENYYRYALAAWSDSNVRIVVCSDDISWCRANLTRMYGDLLKEDRWVFCDAGDSEALRIMISCGQGGICANSTFSWWGAYWGHQLHGATARYTMPCKWGHPPLPTPKDLHPSWVTVLPV